MPQRSATAGLLFLFGMTCTQGPAPEPDLVRNAGFDTWCGLQPCGWDLTQGTATSVASWSEADRAVELSGLDATLQQVVTQAWSYESPLRCLTVQALADGAPLRLELDVQSDDTVDWTADVPASGWETHEFVVAPPAWFGDVTLRVAKPGGATTRVGHLRLIPTECEQPRISQTQPIGRPCLAHDQCQNFALCAQVSPTGETWPGSLHETLPRACGECRSDEECAFGVPCTIGWSPSTFLHRTCGTAPRSLGERCVAGEDCKSGWCSSGRCSECLRNEPFPCECERLYVGGFHLADVCSDDARPAGADCMVHDQCARECVGLPLGLCSNDGRTCDDDTECASSGRCIHFLVRDGVCR